MAYGLGTSGRGLGQGYRRIRTDLRGDKLQRYPSAAQLAPIRSQLGTATTSALGGLAQVAQSYQQRAQQGGPFDQGYMARQRAEIARGTQQRLGQARSVAAQQRARLGRTGLGAAAPEADRRRIQRQGEIDYQRQQQAAQVANYEQQGINLAQLANTLQNQFSISAQTAGMLAKLAAMPQEVPREPRRSTITYYGGQFGRGRV